LAAAAALVLVVSGAWMLSSVGSQGDDTASLSDSLKSDSSGSSAFEEPSQAPAATGRPNESEPEGFAAEVPTAGSPDDGGTDDGGIEVEAENPADESAGESGDEPVQTSLPQTPWSVLFWEWIRSVIDALTT
jgi:hypothetical protein